MTRRAGRPSFARSLGLLSAMTILATACYGGGQGEDTVDLATQEVAGWNGSAAGLGGNATRCLNPLNVCGYGGDQPSRYRQHATLRFSQPNVTAVTHYVDHVGVGGSGSGATVEIQCGQSSRSSIVPDYRFTYQGLWVGLPGTNHWIELGADSTCISGSYYRRTLAQYWNNSQPLYEKVIGSITDYNYSWYTIFRYNPTWWVSVPGHNQEWGLTWGGTAPKATDWDTGLESNDTQGILMRHVRQTDAKYSESERPYDSGQPWFAKSYAWLTGAREQGNNRLHVAKDGSGYKNGLHFCIDYPTPGDPDCH